jgi:hypothetical protein
MTMARVGEFQTGHASRLDVLSWECFDEAGDLDDQHRAKAFPVVVVGHDVRAQLDDCHEACFDPRIGPLNPALGVYRDPMQCGARAYGTHILECSRMAEQLAAWSARHGVKSARLAIAVRYARDMVQKPQPPRPAMTDSELRAWVHDHPTVVETDHHGGSWRWRLYLDADALPETLGAPSPVYARIVTRTGRLDDGATCSVVPTSHPRESAQRWLAATEGEPVAQRDQLAQRAVQVGGRVILVLPVRLRQMPAPDWRSAFYE